MTDPCKTETTPLDGAVTLALMAQLEATLCLPRDRADEDNTARVAAARTMLDSLGAADGLEAMLTCQMLAVHDAAMACLGRAATQAAPPDRTDRELRHGTRLMGLFTRQIEALDRHRVRAADRRDRLELARNRAECRAFVKSIAPTGESALETLLACVTGGDASGEACDGEACDGENSWEEAPPAGHAATPRPNRVVI